MSWYNRHKAEVYDADPNGYVKLVQENNLEKIIEFDKSKKIDPTKCIYKLQPNQEGSKKKSQHTPSLPYEQICLMHVAAFSGATDVFIYFLEKNPKNILMTTPTDPPEDSLSYALYSCNIDIVGIILQQGLISFDLKGNSKKVLHYLSVLTKGLLEFFPRTLNRSEDAEVDPSQIQLSHKVTFYPILELLDAYGFPFGDLKYFQCPIPECIRAHDLDAIKFFLLRANKSGSNDQIGNLIARAIVAGFPDAIPVLIETGIDPFEPNANNLPPLYIAAFSSDVKSPKYIVDYANKAGLSIETTIPNTGHKPYPCYSAIYSAILSQESKFLEIVLTSPSINLYAVDRTPENKPTNFFDNLLLNPSTETFIKMVELLKEHDFNFNARLANDNTILYQLLTKSDFLYTTDRIKRIDALLSIGKADPNTNEFSKDNKPNSVCIKRDLGCFDKEVERLLEKYPTLPETIEYMILQ